MSSRLNLSQREPERSYHLSPDQLREIRQDFEALEELDRTLAVLLTDLARQKAEKKRELFNDVAKLVGEDPERVCSRRSYFAIRHRDLF